MWCGKAGWLSGAGRSPRGKEAIEARRGGTNWGYLTLGAILTMTMTTTTRPETYFEVKQKAPKAHETLRAGWGPRRMQ